MIFNTPISECIQGWLDNQQLKFLRFINNSNKMEDEDHIELAESTSPTTVQETDNEIDSALNSINHSNDVEKHLVNETHKKKHENDREKHAIKQNSTALYGTSDDQAEFIEEALKKKKGKDNFVLLYPYSWEIWGFIKSRQKIQLYSGGGEALTLEGGTGTCCPQDPLFLGQI